MLEHIFHWTSSRSILVGLLLLTSVIRPMGFANGPPDNTVRIAMTILTQIQNQPLVSHVLHGPEQYTAIFCCLCNRGRVDATIQLVVEKVFLSKARSFASNRSSLFPSLPRWALPAWLEFQPRLLRTTAVATTIAHPSDARGLHHVSWPLPSSRSVRLTDHVERQSKFHHTDLLSVSYTFRDRDVLTLRS